MVFASAPAALADGRVALVYGNSTYAHIGRLPNPENDAVDMAAALQQLGFDVTTELDADPATVMTSGDLRRPSDRRRKRPRWVPSTGGQS